MRSINFCPGSSLPTRSPYWRANPPLGRTSSHKRPIGKKIVMAIIQPIRQGIASRDEVAISTSRMIQTTRAGSTMSATGCSKKKSRMFTSPCLFDGCDQVTTLNVSLLYGRTAAARGEPALPRAPQQRCSLNDNNQCSREGGEQQSEDGCAHWILTRGHADG